MIEQQTSTDDGAMARLIERMARTEESLCRAGDARRHFHSTYLRTTRAVAAELQTGRFADPGWVARWDLAFASLYLDALDSHDRAAEVPGPWRAAFAAAADPATPPLRCTLLGMNAHINYDLAQSLVAVIEPNEFDDAELLARRLADHGAIDRILAGRVRAEDRELQRVEPAGSRTLLDRALAPLNTRGTRRFLAESRRKVWHNAVVLDAARREGADRYDARLAELAALAEARVADLARPGQVLLRLARRGFGVQLAPEGARGGRP